MAARLHRRESAAARRFSQVCIIALAILITSSIGLLAYVDGPAPGWLEYLVMASGIMVGISFAGWIAASLAQLARDRLNSR